MKNKFNITLIIIAVMMVTLMNFYGDIRSSLGHSFLEPTFSGYNIYYKGNMIASVGRMAKISYNEDFSAISINDIVHYKNGKKVH